MIDVDSEIEMKAMWLKVTYRKHTENNLTWSELFKLLVNMMSQNEFEVWAKKKKELDDSQIIGERLKRLKEDKEEEKT